MSLAVSTIEWTVGSVVVVLALIMGMLWLTRDRKNRRLRLGVFLERERFEQPQEEPPPVNEIRKEIDGR